MQPCLCCQSRRALRGTPFCTSTGLDLRLLRASSHLASGLPHPPLTRTFRPPVMMPPQKPDAPPYPMKRVHRIKMTSPTMLGASHQWVS